MIPFSYPHKQLTYLCFFRTLFSYRRPKSLEKVINSANRTPLPKDFVNSAKQIKANLFKLGEENNSQALLTEIITTVFRLFHQYLLPSKSTKVTNLDQIQNLTSAKELKSQASGKRCLEIFSSSFLPEALQYSNNIPPTVTQDGNVELIRPFPKQVPFKFKTWGPETLKYDWPFLKLRKENHNVLKTIFRTAFEEDYPTGKYMTRYENDSLGKESLFKSTNQIALMLILIFWTLEKKFLPDLRYYSKFDATLWLEPISSDSEYNLFNHCLESLLNIRATFLKTELSEIKTRIIPESKRDSRSRKKKTTFQASSPSSSSCPQSPPVLSISSSTDQNIQQLQDISSIPQNSAQINPKNPKKVKKQRLNPMNISSDEVDDLFEHKTQMNKDSINFSGRNQPQSPFSDDSFFAHLNEIPSQQDFDSSVCHMNHLHELPSRIELEKDNLFPYLNAYHLKRYPFQSARSKKPKSKDPPNVESTPYNILSWYDRKRQSGPHLSKITRGVSGLSLLIIFFCIFCLYSFISAHSFPQLVLSSLIICILINYAYLYGYVVTTKPLSN